MDNILLFPGPPSALAPDEVDREGEQHRRKMLALRDGLLDLSSNLMRLKLMLSEMQRQLELEAAALETPVPAGEGEDKP